MRTLIQYPAGVSGQDGLAGSLQRADSSRKCTDGSRFICLLWGLVSRLRHAGRVVCPGDPWGSGTSGPRRRRDPRLSLAPRPSWIPHCDSSHEGQHRTSLLCMFSYQHGNLPCTEAKNDPLELLGVNRTEPTGPQRWLLPVCVSVGPAVALGGCQGGQFDKSPVRLSQGTTTPILTEGAQTGNQGW